MQTVICIYSGFRVVFLNIKRTELAVFYSKQLVDKSALLKRQSNLLFGNEHGEGNLLVVHLIFFHQLRSTAARADAAHFIVDADVRIAVFNKLVGMLFLRKLLS